MREVRVCLARSPRHPRDDRSGELNPLFGEIAVVAPGLLGGSLALACRKHGLCRSVVGIARRQETLDIGLRMGAFDRGVREPVEGIAGADLVVLAAPVRASIDLLHVIAPALKPGAIVTDMGSTKAEIMAAAHSTLGPGKFVGGHPMAGSHRSGIAVASADLFEGAPYILSAEADTPSAIRESLWNLAVRLGARPRWIEALDHDRLVARISHLPHVAACALVECADGCTLGSSAAMDLAASGFRDTTRVAAGSAAMWTDICLTSRAGILEALDAYTVSLQRLRSRIAGGDEEALMQWFEAMRSARRRLDTTESGE